MGFEMKLPKCRGCSGEMFSDSDPGSCGIASNGFPQDGGCLGGWLKSGYKDPTNPDCPRNCSAPTHLAELFGAINKEGTNLDDLSRTLNMTSYMMWQIVTTFVQNDDTGWHNYCACPADTHMLLAILYLLSTIGVRLSQTSTSRL